MLQIKADCQMFDHPNNERTKKKKKKRVMVIGRGLLSSGGTTPTWQKATPMIEEVWQQEEADRCARAVSKAKQGRWINRDGAEGRKIAWNEQWNMKSKMLRIYHQSHI